MAGREFFLSPIPSLNVIPENFALRKIYPESDFLFHREENEIGFRINFLSFFHRYAWKNEEKIFRNDDFLLNLPPQKMSRRFR